MEPPPRRATPKGLPSSAAQHRPQQRLPTHRASNVRGTPGLDNYSGAVLASVVASLLIFGVILTMWAWGRFFPALGVDDDWQALLIVFPGLIAGFLANQGELGLSSRLLANARGVLLTSALATFALAGGLVLGVTPCWWGRLLDASLLVSGLCFARLMQWYWRCRTAAAFTQG